MPLKIKAEGEPLHVYLQEPVRIEGAINERTNKVTFKIDDITIVDNKRSKEGKLLYEIFHGIGAEIDADIEVNRAIRSLLVDSIHHQINRKLKEHQIPLRIETILKGEGVYGNNAISHIRLVLLGERD